MVFVAELGRLAGCTTTQLVARHRSVARPPSVCPRRTVATRWSELLAAMRIDKKSRGDVLRFVVLDDLGDPADPGRPDLELLERAYAEVTVRR